MVYIYCMLIEVLFLLVLSPYLKAMEGFYKRGPGWNQQRLVSRIPKQARSFKTYFQYKTRDLHLSLGGEENTASASTVKIGEQCSEGGS